MTETDRTKKNILLITYYFWPEQNPRSNRAYELAKEFQRKGFEITVITRSLGLSRELKVPLRLFEIPITSEDLELHLPSSLKSKTHSIGHGLRRYRKNPIYGRLKIPRIFHFWKLFYWPSLSHHRFCKRGIDLYKNELLEIDFDMTISIADPISTHLLTYLLFKLKLNLGVKVADYGDPFTFNPRKSFSWVNFFKERKVLSVFDYISIPTPKAVEAFVRLGIDQKIIKIIPQGFAIENPTDSCPEIFKNGNDRPYFVFGGMFYEDIRNPENFFQALQMLTKRHKRFHFYVFSNLENKYIADLKTRWSHKLSGYVSFFDKVKRDEFIAILRAADYAVNFTNRSIYQEPSKTIDYALAKVKMFEISMDQTPEHIVEQIEGDNYCLPEFKKENDISEVVQRYIELRTLKVKEKSNEV